MVGQALRMIVWLIVALLAGVVAFLGYLYFNQEGMMFHPTSSIDASPADLGIEFEDVFIEVSNGERIHGWYIPADSQRAAERTVLFFHGNGGNISHRLETVEFLFQLGVPQLHIDYRGYGKSDGSVGEAECYADAVAASDWLAANKSVPPEYQVAFGRSLGGAVAIELATRRRLAGLIVESSFTSAADMGQKMFPFLPVKYLVRYKFASGEKIGSIDCPVLITHSPQDDLIPYHMGEKLFELAAEPKRFVNLQGGHNERWYLNTSDYRAAVAEWTRARPAD